ncbi:5343_t:CDS:2 [Entrophospora sp. SA101]|nr:5343_t:CDS:2 [Entrophospora sp. SA101]
MRLDDDNRKHNKEDNDYGIPKKGTKDFKPNGSSRQEQLTKESLNALNKVLSEERSGSSRQFCIATWYSAPTNKALVTTIKGNHFHNMGHSISGQQWLLPEETLFLLERGSLVVYYNNTPISLQQAYNLMICDWLSFEKTTSLSLLASKKKSKTNNDQNKRIVEEEGAGGGILLNTNKQMINNANFTQRFSRLFIQGADLSFGNTLKRLFGFFDDKNKSEDNGKQMMGPIVKSKSCSSYDEVLKNLQIIERSKDFVLNIKEEEEEYDIDFFVYKQSFKKKSPGKPFFNLIVSCSDSEKPPNLKNLEKLFNKDENSNIVFALVEGGNISFVEVSGEENDDKITLYPKINY